MTENDKIFWVGVMDHKHAIGYLAFEIIPNKFLIYYGGHKFSPGHGEHFIRVSENCYDKIVDKSKRVV